MPKRTTDYHSALLEDLKDPQEAANYLTVALEESEDMFLVALRDVAEAHQMAKVAAGAGVSRESLYRMLVASGNPTSRNLFGILRALDIEFGEFRPRSRGVRRAVTEGHISPPPKVQETRGKRNRPPSHQLAPPEVYIVSTLQGGFGNIGCTNTSGVLWDSYTGNTSSAPVFAADRITSLQTSTAERWPIPQQPGNRSAVLELANRR
jgi:probable addiction module antidote protein